MPFPITLADQITAAKAALFKLMTGSLAEEVRNGDDTVRYAATDIEKLRGYIASLEAEASGSSGRGAIGVSF